jgi:two-component system cell cycle response regulator DivK
MDNELLKGRTIFVVEDNVANMAVFATSLQKYGARVHQDPWNNNTITLLKERLPVDLILMDILLRGGVTGYEIFDEIQRHPELQAIPVIAVSTLDAETEIPKLREKGFAGFISKPVSIYTLPKLILECLEGGEVWDRGRGY